MTTQLAILATIISMFVLVGGLLPYVHDAFGISSSNINTAGLETDVGQGDVSALDVVLSIFLMFFWTFGSLVFWLDLLLIIPRVMLGVIAFQLIRGS